MSPHCRSCVKQQKKVYYQIYKEEKKEYNKQYLEINRKEIRQRQKQYYEINKQEIMARHLTYQKQRKKEDINFKLECNLRTRLGNAINGNYKSGSAVRDLGCSIEEIFKVFEPMYENNPLHPVLGKMRREVYGKINGVLGWTIDHIVPLSSFDLTKREELLKAVHFSNLRPMWGNQNCSENDRGMSRRKKQKENK